jgi:hypothetical protein
MKNTFVKLSQFFAFAFLAISFSSCQQGSTDSTPWVDLFDGQTLEGWTQLAGEA